jgi:hypothetical protein
LYAFLLFTLVLWDIPITLLFNWSLSCITHEVYRKVPGLGQKRNAGLTYSILATISLKIVSFGMYTAIPSFFPHFKSTVEVIFLNGVEYPFECQTLFQNVVLSLLFSILETNPNFFNHYDPRYKSWVPIRLLS